MNAQPIACSQCGATFGPGTEGFSHCDMHAPVTKVQRNRELTDLLPLEPTRDDLVECLLPLVPEEKRRGGSYLRAGFVIS